MIARVLRALLACLLLALPMLASAHKESDAYLTLSTDPAKPTVLHGQFDIALRDQEEAGIDVVSDGEMRRAGFFTAEFYRHLTGLRPLEPVRRVGAPGHDQQHRRPGAGR